MTATWTRTPPAPTTPGATGQRPVSGAAAGRVPRGRRRSTGQLGLAVLLVLGCAAVSAALYRSADDRTQVVVAARDIAAGTLISAQDLRAGELSGSGVAAIEGSHAPALIGQTATTSIPSGALLTVDMVAQTPPPGPGRAAVGVALPPGRLPTELTAGRHVQVLLVPAGQDATTAAPAGTVLVGSAQVLSVSADPSGMWLVSVAVESAAVPAVTAAAAVDRVAVSMLPLETAATAAAGADADAGAGGGAGDG